MIQDIATEKNEKRRKKKRKKKKKKRKKKLDCITIGIIHISQYTKFCLSYVLYIYIYIYIYSKTVR